MNANPRTEAPAHGLERLTYRIDEIAAMLGTSRRTIERERSAGRFPPPDAKIGRIPLWKRSTLTTWVSGGGRK